LELIFWRKEMMIDRSIVQLFLFILLAVFSAFLLRAAISVNKERAKERADRKNQVTQIKKEAS
jgi:membrane protein implicated in regulation of membrane protease activity